MVESVDAYFILRYIKLCIFLFVVVLYLYPIFSIHFWVEVVRNKWRRARYTVELFVWDKRTPLLRSPGEMIRYALYLFPLLKEHLYSGEKNTFSGSGNPILTSFQGTPWHSKSNWQQLKGLISFKIHQPKWLQLLKHERPISLKSMY